MRCEKIRDDILDWVNGELSSGRKKLIDEHLNKCELCRQELDLVKMGDSRVRSITSRLKQEGTYLTSERLSDMEDELNSTTRIGSLYRWGSVAGTAAAVIIALLFVPSFLSSPDTSSEDRRLEATDDVQASLLDDGPARQDGRPMDSNAGWKVRLVDEQGDSKTVRGYMRPADVPHSSVSKRQVSMHRNSDKDVYIPVEKGLYDVDADGYWW